MAPTVATTAVNRAIWLIMLPLTPWPSAACWAACSSSWSCGPCTWNPPPDMSDLRWNVLVSDETVGQAGGGDVTFARRFTPFGAQLRRESITFVIRVDFRDHGDLGAAQGQAVDFRSAGDPGLRHVAATG